VGRSKVLPPGVNFINVLQAALAHTDPESVKKTIKLLVVFMLLGSARVKAVRITLMKLTPVRLSSPCSVITNSTEPLVFVPYNCVIFIIVKVYVGK